MDAKFWQRKWENSEIGFHRSEANPLLVDHLPKLSLEKGDRVFVPLCGKTLDIAWLLAHGYRVAGAELVEMAIEQLFMGLGVEPNVSEVGAITQYSAPNIDIFGGDIFQLSRQRLGVVDAIYDRAALVALPGDLRNRYTAHLVTITQQAPQLLITYDYDQALMDGPPFSICNKDVHRQYGTAYDLTLISSKEVVGGLKGQCVATENVWMLHNVS